MTHTFWTRSALWLALGLSALYLSACATVPEPVAVTKTPAFSPERSFARNVKPESRKAEAALLRRYPDMARRDDNTLSLYRNGQVFATRLSNPADCEGFNTCKLWLFDGPIALLNPKTHRVEPYPQLIFEHGEGGAESVVLPDGQDYWMNTHGLASPDGKWIATGEGEIDDMDDSDHLSLYDWTGGTSATVFAPSCKPLAWQDNSHFTAKCQVYSETSTDTFEGAVSRDAKGQWQLKVTRIISQGSTSTNFNAQKAARDLTGKVFTGGHQP